MKMVLLAWTKEVMVQLHEDGSISLDKVQDVYSSALYMKMVVSGPGFDH
jgi:hypothetical protein